MNLEPEVIAAGITALVTGVGVPAVFLQARAATKSAQAAVEAAQATREAGHAQAEAVYKAALDGARTHAQEQTEQWRREQRRDAWTEFLHNADHVEDLCTGKRHRVSADVSDAWQALRRSLAKLELVGPRDIAARAHDVTKTLGGLIDDHYFITVVEPVFERLNAMWAEAHPHIVIGPGEDWPTCPPDHRACLAQDALHAVWRLTSTARAHGIAQPVVEAEEAVDSGEIADPRCYEDEPDERLRLLGEINGAYGDLIYRLDGVRGLPELDDHVLMTRACLDPSEFYRQHESRVTAFNAAREAFLTAAQEEIVGTAS